MQRQPRTPQQAAMLDPLGLSTIAPNMPSGIFGGGRRRKFMRPSANAFPPGDGVPPQISDAPPPPTDWKNIVGPELLSSLSQTAPYADQGIGQDSGVSAPPALQAPAPTSQRGMIAPPRFSASPGGSIGKFANHGASMSDRSKARDKPGFFDRGGAGIDIIGGLADGLAQYFGGQAQYVPAMYKRRQDEMNHNQRLAEMRENARIKMSEPDYATIGNRRVRIDPTTGQAEVLFTAPQAFDDYAAALGAEPGTEEYDRLVQDYVLRHSGPTATDFNLEEEDHRQGNRVALEGIRQSNRSTLEGQRQSGRRALKSVPTYRQANPAPPRAGGGGSSAPREGATATNPQTGAKVVYRGGKWVPVK